MTTEPQAEPQAQNRRRGRRVSRARLIFVGVWVSAAIGALIWIEGPFWKDAVVWYEQARVAAAEGRWSDALEGIGEARAKVPDDPGLATFEGYTLLELDRPADAITSFRVALDSLPDDTQARLGLASALIALADTAAARDVLVGFRPPTDDTAALVRHAALAESIQEPAVALRSLEQAPTAANLSDRVRLALAAELWETAITLLEEEVATAGRPASEGELAWALERAGRRDEALERYADLHERRALDEQTGIRYVWMLDEDGRYGEAMQVLRSLPPGPEVSFLLARTALWAGDLAESAALVDVLEESGDPRAASLRAELEAEAARLARLREEGERRRLADTPPDDPELALAFWQDRVVRDPSDAAARGEAVALLESAGRFEEAARTLLGARTDSDPTGADEVAHLARLRHWGGQHELAVDLFGRLEELRAASGLEAGETLMLAESLLSLGRAAEAHDRLAPLADGASPTIEIVSAAARAATDAGRTTDAVRHLRGLAQIRPLDVAERRWLAGQLRAAGEVEAALAAYMDLRDLDPDDREAALAVADLELALGRYGPAASDYESLGMEGSDPATPRHAAALAELGRYEEAIRLYRSHLGAGDDAETRLALARTLARQGDPEAALAEYEVLLAVLDGNEIALELAQVHAALGAFGEARRWAEIAEERTGAWEARLLLAETARYEGRLGEATERLRELERREVEGVEGAYWHARVSHLLDRPLEAQEILTDASAQFGDRFEGRHWLFLAEVAFGRGDLRRTRAALAEAEAGGAPPLMVSRFQTRLARALRAHASIEFTVGSDAVDLTSDRFRAGASVRGSAQAPRIRVDIERNELEQGLAQASVTSVTVGADSLFLGPRSWASARLGIDATDSAGESLSGALAFERSFSGGSAVGAAFARDPLWVQLRGGDLARYPRLRDLAALGVGPVGNDVRVRGRLALGIQRHAQVEVGGTRYDDGNDRLYAYTHLQLPLHAAVDQWLAVSPNFYVERFSEPDVRYASPEHYVSAGVRGQWSLSGSRTMFSGMVNPHYFSYPGEKGLGVELNARLSVDLGPLSAGIDGVFFKQADVYDFSRLSVSLTLPALGH